LHTILGIAAANIGSAASGVQLQHEYAVTGKGFAGNTSDGAGIASAAYSIGEAIHAAWNEGGVAGDDISLLGFMGFRAAHADAELVEFDEDLEVTASGPERGLDTLTVVVDNDYAPTTDQTDTVTIIGNGLPDTWYTENVSASGPLE